MKSVAIAACAVFVSSSCLANELCEAALRNLAPRERSGLYLTINPALTDWRKMKDKEILPNSPFSVVYFGQPKRSGAIAVKTVRELSTTASPVATHVTLRRRDDINQCEISRTTRTFWFFFPVSYVNGIPVTVDDYVKYHRDRTPNAEIERFHIKYVGRDGACLASNDSNGGNREQFQYEDNRYLPAISDVVAGRIGVTTPAFAHGALKSVGFAETQIAVYSENKCAGFEFRPEGPGTYNMRINDLEIRDRSGQRVKDERKVQVRIIGN